MNVGGKACNNDAPGGAVHNLIQHRSNVRFARSEAGNICVRGVHQEQVNPFFAESGKRAKIGESSIEGKLVHLEVAGVKNGTSARANHDSQSVGNRVVYGYELKVKGSELLATSRLHRHGEGSNPVLLELCLNQSQGEGCPNEGDVLAKPQQVGNRPDVVLVTVGQHDGDHVIKAISDWLKVRQDQVNAGLSFLGEKDPAVHDEQLAIDVEDGHVATDFTNPAERDDAESSGK